ncbi:type II toxin-antitoxin system ribonuclease VapC1 [soil metagenome]
MTVVDASAVIELLLGQPVAARLAQQLIADPTIELAAPHLLDAEVGQVLRRFERSGELGESAARGAVNDLAALPILRYPHGPLLDRAYDLRHNVTIYDALYLALAETLDEPCVTEDAAMFNVPGCRATVQRLAET